MSQAFFEHPLYQEDVGAVAAAPVDWEKLVGATVLISGATGMIGSLIVDVLMKKRKDLGCRVICLGRSEPKARGRFPAYFDEGHGFSFVTADVAEGIPEVGPVDYVFHAASNTHPVAYASDPVGTILLGVTATDRMLSYAASHGCRRFLFASSNEIYGENRGDTEYFDESYLGYIDCNTLRAGYPEGKRCGEALCQAYRKAAGLDCVVVRFTRSYGPSLLPTDTKALSQFLRNALAGEDIILKSAGTQQYSYTYAADAASAFFYLLDKGADGEAYNVADPRSDVRLKDLAEAVARAAGTKVVFDLPDEVEAAGFSKATKALLDASKLRALGWQARFGIEEGIRRTIRVLGEVG